MTRHSPPPREIRPAGNRTDSQFSAGTGTVDPTVVELLDHLGAVQRRVVHEALLDASRSYWLRRADDFRAALPRQDEWHGHEGLAGVRRRRERLLQVIAACEAKAEIALCQDDDLHGVA